MIRKKLSTQKSKIETQNTLAYTIKKAALVESNRCQIGTNQEFIEFLAKKFDKACKGKQENTSFHETLSFHTSDNITPEKALEIAKELYSDTIGLNREHSFAVHNDTDELHIHFIWAPKDFNNKPYYQKNDYRIIEKKLAELEIKHNLYQVENRKALKPDLETQPRKSKKEQALEQRGIETIKSQFKKDVRIALHMSRTTTNFFGYLHDKGYDIIPNGKTGYSITKNGNTFKSSSVGCSYASLKKRLEEQHDFAELLEHYRKKEKEEVDAHISTNAKVGRPQKLSATPDLSGTVLPLCPITNSVSPNVRPFNSALPKVSASGELPGCSAAPPRPSAGSCAATGPLAPATRPVLPSSRCRSAARSAGLSASCCRAVSASSWSSICCVRVCLPSRLPASCAA